MRPSGTPRAACQARLTRSDRWSCDFEETCDWDSGKTPKGRRGRGAGKMGWGFWPRTLADGVPPGMGSESGSVVCSY